MSRRARLQKVWLNEWHEGDMVTYKGYRALVIALPANDMVPEGHVPVVYDNRASCILVWADPDDLERVE